MDRTKKKKSRKQLDRQNLIKTYFWAKLERKYHDTTTFGADVNRVLVEYDQSKASRLEKILFGNFNELKKYIFWMIYPGEVNYGKPLFMRWRGDPHCSTSIQSYQQLTENNFHNFLEEGWLLLVADHLSTHENQFEFMMEIEQVSLDCFAKFMKRFASVDSDKGRKLEKLVADSKCNRDKWKDKLIGEDFTDNFKRRLNLDDEMSLDLDQCFLPMKRERKDVISADVNEGENVHLKHGGSSVEVDLCGTRVTSWKNGQGEELLFVSSNIHGGILIGFPRFGSGELHHGWSWSIDTNPPLFSTMSYNDAFIDLLMIPSEEDRKGWPHSYDFRLRVALGLGGKLMLTSRIRNTNNDGKPFTFTFAYHTYISVSDISEVQVTGLKKIAYLDTMLDDKRSTKEADGIMFECEVNKIYVNTAAEIAIVDSVKKITLRKEGLPDAVVWSPWDKKAKAMVDFGDDEYKHMLCVEAAAVETPITLKPGEDWEGRLELSAVPSSSCSGQLNPHGVLQ